jgi:hypothetical protein
MCYLGEFGFMLEKEKKRTISTEMRGTYFYFDISLVYIICINWSFTLLFFIFNTEKNKHALISMFILIG